eukprot:UN15836
MNVADVVVKCLLMRGNLYTPPLKMAIFAQWPNKLLLNSAKHVT